MRFAFRAQGKGCPPGQSLPTAANTPLPTPCRERFGSTAATTSGGPDAPVGADWVRQGPRQSARGSLLAAAVSSDGRYLATGGGDKKVHIWDARSRELVKVGGRLVVGVGEMCNRGRWSARRESGEGRVL